MTKRSSRGGSLLDSVDSEGGRAASLSLRRELVDERAVAVLVAGAGAERLGMAGGQGRG